MTQSNRDEGTGKKRKQSRRETILSLMTAVVEATLVRRFDASQREKFDCDAHEYPVVPFSCDVFLNFICLSFIL